MRILVVDDVVAQAESLCLLLKVTGHQAMSSLNTSAALELAKVHRPDAVVLDWLLPHGGVAFIRVIRALPDLEHIPVVVTTGLPLERVEGLDTLDHVALLQKPFTVEELLGSLALVAV